MDNMNWIIALVLFGLTIAGYWKIFEKAGLEGWKSIIPFYDSYCLSKIVFGNGWLFLIGIIPGISVIFYIIRSIMLAKVFGKGILFMIGLNIFPYIFVAILGLGDSQYEG